MKILRDERVFPGLIFASSFLLFSVEPLIGKYLLPAFGGASSVWIVAVSFFMVWLLAGYVYANWLTGLRPRIQGALHAFLMLASAVLLGFLYLQWASPIMPPLGWFASWEPKWSVLALLAAGIGLPFFLLASTNTILQSWFARRSGRAPHSFYAVSNAGSFAGLLSYPFLVEPFLSLQNQGRFWSAAYLLLALFIAAISLVQVKIASMTQMRKRQLGRDRKMYWYWTGLSFLPAALLLAITNQITQGVAPVPFLWLGPLGVYLLSFILPFSSWWQGKNKITVLLVLVAIFALLCSEIVGWDFTPHILLLNLVLFVTGLLCHSRLYEHRPGIDRLPSFYVMIGIGGALGGIFVGIIAPSVFESLWEYLILLFAAVLVALWFSVGIWFNRRQIFAIGLTAALALGSLVFREVSDSTLRSRNFYGTLKLISGNSSVGDELLQLLNGRIVHGAQFRDREKALLPTTYYGENSGAGLVLSNHPARIAVIGLGVGTLAAYCREGDELRFYEINPAVVEVAEKYFSYLAQCRNVKIILGDARLSLQAEIGNGKSNDFDAILVDAFTDDAMPVHLLTAEALGIYLRHLDDRGVLAIHISNRHLDLEPVMAALAGEFGLQSLVVQSAARPDQAVYPAIWVLMARSGEPLEREQVKTAGRKITDRKIFWSDNYSSLVQILK